MRRDEIVVVLIWPVFVSVTDSKDTCYNMRVSSKSAAANPCAGSKRSRTNITNINYAID
jgi:hypothetical protein